MWDDANENIFYLSSEDGKVAAYDVRKCVEQKKEDTKVTLHSTAAIQNLTYKNTACCSEVRSCALGESAASGEGARPCVRDVDRCDELPSHRGERPGSRPFLAGSARALGLATTLGESGASARQRKIARRRTSSGTPWRHRTPAPVTTARTAR